MSASNPILDAQVREYVKQGYTIDSRTPTTAQLTKHKAWSKLGCILGGWLFYWIYFQFKKSHMIYLEVGADGKIKTTRRNVS